ncbi:MAG: transglycosylase SLT domain-containing protein [Legionella sp.]
MNSCSRFFKKLRIATVVVFASLLTACVSHPPADVNNLCNIFKQYPRWYRDTKDVERRWKVPVPVQMAIIHQESKFNARARPPRTKLLWIIPWKRPSSAYGYSQALNVTWRHYKQNNGGLFSSRKSFSDGVDFIGWYANQAYKQAGVPRTDAYSLYLAYHEGIGGYRRKTYLKKPWLISVARKVKWRSQTYAMQLNSCHKRFESHSWF